MIKKESNINSIKNSKTNFKFETNNDLKKDEDEKNRKKRKWWWEYKKKKKKKFLTILFK